jgi:hypothetical protein
MVVCLRKRYPLRGEAARGWVTQPSRRGFFDCLDIREVRGDGVRVPQGSFQFRVVLVFGWFVVWPSRLSVDLGSRDFSDGAKAFGRANEGQGLLRQFKRAEKDGGTTTIERTGSDALDDDGDGGLDGAAILRDGEFECRGCVGEGRAFAGFAAVVVEVAEDFVAKSGRSTTVTVVKDVAAFPALGIRHWWLLKGYFQSCKG